MWAKIEGVCGWKVPYVLRSWVWELRLSLVGHGLPSKSVSVGEGHSQSCTLAEHYGDGGL